MQNEFTLDIEKSIIIHFQCSTIIFKMLWPLQDISPGFESQVAVTPTLYETSEEARTRFLPEERGCYFEGELPLKYLEHGIYRYNI